MWTREKLHPVTTVGKGKKVVEKVKCDLEQKYLQVMCADARGIIVAGVRRVFYIQASLSRNEVTLNAAQ